MVLLKVPHLSAATQKVITKFFELYEEPYRITRTIGKNAFEISTIHNSIVKGIYNRFNLRKYNAMPDFSVNPN